MIPGMGALDGIRGVLLDIDGTLIAADREIPGAAATLAEIERRDLPYRLITNTSRRPRSAIAAVLAAAGFISDATRVLTPTLLARRLVIESGRTRTWLLVAPATREDLVGLDPVEASPDWVVVGDVGDGFTYAAMDRAFRFLLEGAGLIALHKNRYWHDGSDLRIDAGPFVAALEYAAGVQANVVGKPSREFFRLAAEDLAIDDPGAILMVGDDVTTDCAGAKEFGCRAALVRTGKFRDADLARGPAPDLVLDSVADLVAR